MIVTNPARTCAATDSGFKTIETIRVVDVCDRRIGSMHRVLWRPDSTDGPKGDD